VTEAEKRAYARKLVLDAAQSVEYLTVHEMAEEVLGYPILDSDADEVFDLVMDAEIQVLYP
jgi:hypothetical protein